MQGVTFFIFTFTYVKKGFAGVMGLEMGLGWPGPPLGHSLHDVVPPPEAPDEEDMVEHFLNLN